MDDLPFIISASQLQQAITKYADRLHILDIREQEDYKHKHIPNAHWFNKNAVNRSDGKTSGLLPHKKDLYNALVTSGYHKEKHLVIYNANCNPLAGRVTWTLFAYGLRNVSLLDGGFDYWQQVGLATSDKTTHALESNFLIESLSTPSNEIACDYQYINNHLHSPNSILLDARTAEEFKGQDIRSQYGGHIPGAININWTETKTDDGLLFKPADELKQLFAQHGINKDSRIITYCQSHQRSALVAMLLLHLGYQYTTGYPGAWSDWGNRENTAKSI